MDDVLMYNRGDLAIGMDIGTTTISAAVIDLDHRKQVEVFSIPHNSYVENGVFSEQSVPVIMENAEGLLELIYRSYRNIVSIGVTGQMHGIVYLDDVGRAVSNLINWQDKRGDVPINEGLNVCQLIKQLTGETVATGYGLATHTYNLQNGFVPQTATCFCSIMDYLVMRLCNQRKPITHTSIAASFGLFDMEKECFKLDKVETLGIDAAFLPKVTASNQKIGTWREIPVFVAIGDNQASFLGSVKNNKDSVLVNIGTGSQISAVRDRKEFDEGIECRPLINSDRLLCGSALCGGSAYALLEGFFRSYASAAGIGDNAQYGIMNDLAEKAYCSGERPLSVDTSFCGTRSDPSRRGTIEKLDLNNFTPSALILGVIHGMCEELYQLYQAGQINKKHIVASGGAVRNNPVLRKVLEDKFGMSVSVSTVKEEAATGAALYSGYALGRIAYKNGFADFIHYIDS